jgi:hypothetical protein
MPTRGAPVFSMPFCWRWSAVLILVRAGDRRFLTADSRGTAATQWCLPVPSSSSERRTSRRDGTTSQGGNRSGLGCVEADYGPSGSGRRCRPELTSSPLRTGRRLGAAAIRGIRAPPPTIIRARRLFPDYYKSVLADSNSTGNRTSRRTWPRPAQTRTRLL